MKKKILILIVMGLLIPSITSAEVQPPPVSCPPPGSNNIRPVLIGSSGETTLQSILNLEFGAGMVNANTDQQTAGRWSFTAGFTMSIELAAGYAGYQHEFGIFSCNGTNPSQVVIFNYGAPADTIATLSWDSSANLKISGNSPHVNNGTFPMSPCSFGFFLHNSNDGKTYYTVDSMNGEEAHALAYRNPNTNRWAIAFEDLPLGSSDKDYQDLVVAVDSLSVNQTDTDGDGICDVFDNCPQVYNPDQADSNNDGLGDACSGGPDTEYTLDPPKPVVYGSNDAMLTTTFCNYTGQDIVTPRPDCISNTTFTLTDSDGIIVLPIDRIRTAYAINTPGPKSDVITIANETCIKLDCPLSELFPPEADILIPGNYLVKGTFSNYIQVPSQNLWMGAIKSTDQTLTVYRYAFAGFFAPVENPPAVNKAKAGQAVPVKWKITDANGTGISDPSSFAGLYSYQSNCQTWSQIGPEVQESAAGSSGLQYIGGGNWQFNWKTPKTYANQCRVMELKLDDGNTRTARFQFK